MPKLNINGREIEVEDGITLLQACELAGFEIPRFCYHERLSVAGNCRMCLVEVVGMPKPMASCATSVNDLRPNRDGTPPAIRTDSPLVKKAREGVMEFLLVNHPLDCPICDQGGECDLQDQALYYGQDGSRYREAKRAVEEKYLGPLIKTFMTRCIQCTRCVRFMTEIAGVPELGLISRGEDVEITTYLEQGMVSELSGNVVDLCPVGALTSKPYSYTARPWELRKTESVDVMDGLGSNIRIDSRGREVLRILPRNHDAVNEEWISDKTRAAVDALKRKRLDRPYMRVGGKLEEVSWYDAFSEIAVRVSKARGKGVGAIAGDLATVEEMFALKALLGKLGSPHHDCRQLGAKLHPKHGRTSYLFNSAIAGVDKADAILLIGANPRTEAAVLNARIRKAWLQNRAKVALIGPQADLTYPYEWLGNSLKLIDDTLEGRNNVLATLKAALHPMIIVGQAALNHAAGETVLLKAAQLAAAVMDGQDFVLESAQRAAHERGASWRPRYRLCAGRRRPRRARHARQRRYRSALPARRRRVRREQHRRRLRDLPGLAWRPRRAACRHRAARRRLYREERHLCEYRGPRAAWRARRVPARRRARGLGHHPRAFGASGPETALR